MNFDFDKLIKEIEDKNQSIDQSSQNTNPSFDALPFWSVLMSAKKLVEQMKVDALTILKVEQYRQDKGYAIFDTPFPINQTIDDLIELGLKKLTICSCAIWANKNIIIKLAANKITAYSMNNLLDEFAINMQERGYVMKCSASKIANSHNHKIYENCN